MSYTKEQRFNKAYNAVIDYVKKNGADLGAGLIVWDTYPVCVKDKCYDKIIVKNDKLYAANDKDLPKEWRDISQLDHKYVAAIVPDLQKADAKVKKK